MTAPARTQGARWARDALVGRRALVIACAGAALVCTRIAADRTVPALDLAVVLATVVAVAAPDSHLGLLPLALVVTDWGVSVDGPISPWSMATAAAVLGLHASLAACGAAPPGAAWTSAMRHRWVGRVVLVAGAGVPVWVLGVALSGAEVTASSLLVTVALLLLAIWALWARDGRDPTA